MAPKAKAAKAQPAAPATVGAAPKAAAVASSPTEGSRGSGAAATAASDSRPATSSGLRPGSSAGGSSGLAEAERKLAEVSPEEWEKFVALDDPPACIRSAVKATMALLGEASDDWALMRKILEDLPALVRLLKAAGPWGAPDDCVEAASSTLDMIALRQLTSAASPNAGAKAAAGPAAKAGAKAAAKGPAKAAAKATAASAPKAKAKVQAKATAGAPPSQPGAEAAVALGNLLEVLLAVRKADKAPPFPMVWPVVPFAQLHGRLQQAMLSRQVAVVLCAGQLAYQAMQEYCSCIGAAVENVKALMTNVSLAKTLTMDAARAKVGSSTKKAMQEGRRCVLFLGQAPPNLRHLCDSSHLPLECFDGEKVAVAATSLGLQEAKKGFHMCLVVQLSKAAAEQQLAHVIPGFDEMAVLMLETASLPSELASKEKDVAQEKGETDRAKTVGWLAALRLLAKQPADPPCAEEATDEAPVDATGQAPAIAINTEAFEFLESFGEDWQSRWMSGPNTVDENGKPIRQTLISTKLIKHPSEPTEAKPCLQLMGGMPNAPCTGIWTSFTPLARPTEVEMVLTMNGKVDVPNACVVFTEKPFEDALPDTKIGVQFLVRGGMQLASGGLVRISNDGKIKNDKWNKVLLQIDWQEKVVIGQVDSTGKGYPPAVQTVPFRDSTCQGFGFIYIYNMETQATTWIHSLRVRQAEGAAALNMKALDARAHLKQRLEQKEYQRAVDEDMRVGMVMGAIQSTQQHGMNLAQEQAVNSSSAAGAAMG